LVIDRTCLFSDLLAHAHEEDIREHAGTQKHVVVSTPFYASEKALRALITSSNASKMKQLLTEGVQVPIAHSSLPHLFAGAPHPPTNHTKLKTTSADLETLDFQNILNLFGTYSA
jgi:hypothetical protein